MVKSEAENVMEAEVSGLVLVVQGYSSMVNLFGVSGFIAGICEWCREHMRSSMSYLSG
jgi:hypothetical protein